MEEKLSVLESLGAAQGLVEAIRWNVLRGTQFIHNLASFKLSKEQHPLVFETTENDIKSTESHNVQECTDHNLHDTLEREEGGKECNMEIERPENETSEDSSPGKTFCLLQVEDTDDPPRDADNCSSKGNKDNPMMLSETDAYSKMASSAVGTYGSYDDFNDYSDGDGNEDIADQMIPITLNGDKSPSTVQDWVNRLPTKNKNQKDCIDCGDDKDESPENPNNVMIEDSAAATAKLSRETSIQSSSSLDSILDSRRPDPVEIFLNLGFGGLPGVDMENCRIPKRFLVPSKCKGGDWHEFLKRELIQAQNFECSSLGFRGLSGPSYRRPSAIVANIMEKLRENSVPQTHTRSRFSTVARRVLNEKSVLNKLTSEFQSVLSPDSRKFLQNQGKISPEVPRRRIIFGQKSFAFAHDGEFVEVESSKVHPDQSKDNPAALPLKTDAEDAAVFGNANVLLKLRRSSLQKQKKVEEDLDSDVEDVFYIVGNEEHSVEAEPCSFRTNKCSRKAGKIPRRFFSSSNLKSLEKENLSEAMRLEVEKEIRTLSQKIKSISHQDLASVLQQVKKLRSSVENSALAQPSHEI